MLADLIAGRYSKALFRAAEAGDALPQVGIQAGALRKALLGPEAEAFLRDPLAEPSAKLEALTAAFDGEIHPVLRSFLDAVLSNKREPYLPAMLEAFARLCDVAEGRIRAGLGVAHALKPSELELLRASLSKSLRRDVILLPYTDRSLIGGAVLKLDDTVYDGSIRAGLERLGRALLAEPKAPASAKAGAGLKPGVKRAAGKGTAAPRKSSASGISKRSSAKSVASANVKAKNTAKAKDKAKTKASVRTPSGAPQVKTKVAKKKAS
ncbi:MAG: ATP synthase F1 subunit delta [bacterium]